VSRTCQARLRTADGGEVAYVRLHFFASETTRAVQAALLAGEQDGVDGYILDLRNNPGDRAVSEITPVYLRPLILHRWPAV